MTSHHTSPHTSHAHRRTHISFCSVVFCLSDLVWSDLILSGLSVWSWLVCLSVCLSLSLSLCLSRHCRVVVLLCCACCVSVQGGCVGKFGVCLCPPVRLSVCVLVVSVGLCLSHCLCSVMMWVVWVVLVGVLCVCWEGNKHALVANILALEEWDRTRGPLWGFVCQGKLLTGVVGSIRCRMWNSWTFAKTKHRENIRQCICSCDTVVVLTINHPDRLLHDSFSTLWEIKVFGLWEECVARLKLKGIDGRAPPGVEPAAQFDSTRKNTPGPDTARIHRLITLSWFYGWRCMAVFFVGEVNRLVNFVDDRDLCLLHCVKYDSYLITGFIVQSAHVQIR